MADLSRIRAIVFDIGGTLLNFEHPESRAHLREGARRAHAFLQSQCVNPPTVSLYTRRLERRFLAAYLWSRLRRGELDPVRTLQGVHDRLGIALDQRRLQQVAGLLYEPIHDIGHAAPGTVAALEQLRDRGYMLALISNTVAPPCGLDAHLEAEGLLHFFPIRVYSCEYGVPKPNRGIFASALQKIGVAAHEAAYVGDKPAIDVRGARRAGMTAILRSTDGRAHGRPKADLVIREISELPDLFPDSVPA